MENSWPISVYINPVSGRGAGVRLHRKLREAVETDQFLKERVSGIHITRETEGPELAERLRGSKTILVCGGDGTIHSMAGLILRAAPKTWLSVFPLGTGNDFAANIGSGERDILRHLRKIAEKPETVPLDIFSLNGSAHFINYASFGIDATILVRYQAVLDGVGRLSRFPHLKKFIFFLAGLSTLATFREKVGEGNEKGVSIIVSNVRTYAGGSVIAPGSDPGDGKLEISRIRSKAIFLKLVLNRFFPSLRVEPPSFSPPVTIRTGAPVAVQVDGEDYTEQFGAVTEFTVSLAGRLTVCR